MGIHGLSVIFTKGNIFCEFLFTSLNDVAFLKSDHCPTIVRYPKEQVLSCRSRPPLRKDANIKVGKLFSLKLYTNKRWMEDLGFIAPLAILKYYE